MVYMCTYFNPCSHAAFIVIIISYVWGDISCWCHSSRRSSLYKKVCSSLLARPQAKRIRNSSLTVFPLGRVYANIYIGKSLTDRSLVPRPLKSMSLGSRDKAGLLPRFTIRRKDLALRCIKACEMQKYSNFFAILHDKDTRTQCKRNTRVESESILALLCVGMSVNTQVTQRNVSPCVYCEPTLNVHWHSWPAWCPSLRGGPPTPHA